jgi:hypothetical protein
LRSLRGLGGGGRFNALVSTGAVALREVVAGGPVVEVVDGAVVATVADRVGEVVDSGGDALPPLPDESTIATITPPAAAAATAAASAAFFTESEATLAPPWLHASKSS